MIELRDLRYQKVYRNSNEMIKHLKGFKISPKFSVGMWFFSPGGGRFHDRFVPDLSIEERINILAEMKNIGISGVEAHYPKEINEDNIDLYKNLEKETGIKVVGIPFSHFFDKKFEFGALSNPDPEIRKIAINIAVGGMRLAREIGAYNVISWPGMDGFTYDIGTIYPWMWRFYDEAMAEVIDKVPGIRVALEPKPYEPAINNIFRTTAEGILAAQRIESLIKNEKNLKYLNQGYSLFGLNPEFGHVRMGYEPAGAVYALVGMHGRLAHVHLNSQPLGNFDQDLNVGVVDIQQSYAMLYSLKMMGYQEYMGIDINPEHMPVETAVEINVKMVEKMLKKLDKLPHYEIIDCYLHPDKNRGKLENILMKYLY
ncbi:MAG: sugar phosphate isomerase/epimerase family protein [Promethearchaeota archaeon]